MYHLPDVFVALILACAVVSTLATSTSKSSTLSPKKTTSTSRSLTSSTIKSTSLKSPSLSSSLASSRSGVLFVPGCPPITTTTSTFYVVATVQTSTVTSISTAYTRLTSFITSSEDVTYTTDVSISTVVIYTSTRTAISVSPAKTTVTVHTSSGFTPIRCNAAYYNPTVTVTSSTYTDTNPTVSVVRGSLSTSYTTAYSYVYNTVATVTDTSLHYVTQFPTVTVTSTRTDPTSTVYDACATNNFASQLPGGSYIGKTSPKDATVFGKFVPSVDAVDCCAQCQASLNCTGSAYNGVFYQYYPCQLFTKGSDANQTCDPKKLEEQAYQSYPQPVISISNSGCGQYELLN